MSWLLCVISPDLGLCESCVYGKLCCTRVQCHRGCFRFTGCFRLTSCFLSIGLVFECIHIVFVFANRFCLYSSRFAHGLQQPLDMPLAFQATFLQKSVGVNKEPIVTACALEQTGTPTSACSHISALLRGTEVSLNMLYTTALAAGSAGEPAPSRFCVIRYTIQLALLQTYSRLT